MAEIASMNDLSFSAELSDGYGTLRQADAGEVVLSPDEAIRLGMALRAWGEVALEAEQA